MKLKQKIALVTGSGSGIGKETASLFASEGASVISVDLNYDTAFETLEVLRKYNDFSSAIACDVSSDKDVVKVVNFAIEKYGTIDILFNGAGIHSRNAMISEGTPEEIWDRVIAVNLKGTYLVNAKYTLLNQLIITPDFYLIVD